MNYISSIQVDFQMLTPIPEMPSQRRVRKKRGRMSTVLIFTLDLHTIRASKQTVLTTLVNVSRVRWTSWALPTVRDTDNN